jgi:hypothetical protein
MDSIEYEKLYGVPVLLQDVIGKMVENEAVLVLAHRGEVKVLNEVAARIWSLVDGQRSIRTIAQMISEEYQVDDIQAQADTLEFVENLEQRGILSILNPSEVN